MKAIANVSGKGGVGKTTTAINLGIALNKLGRDITIVDADISTPGVGLSLGSPSVPIALQHVLSGQNKIQDALYMHNSGVKIVPSSLAYNQTAQLQNLKQTIKQLKGTTDLVLIDSSAGIEDNVALSINSADECLIVTNPEMPALSSALKTINIAKMLGKPVIGAVLTKSHGKKELSEKSISAFLDLPILGTIPEDKNMRTALQNKEAIIISHPNSKASRGYNRLAKKLLTGEDMTSFDKFKDFLTDIFN